MLQADVFVMSPSKDHPTLRYFLSYRGTGVPLNFCEELAPDALRHRNTYFRAGYDSAGRMLWCEKMVYEEVEMRHDYTWDATGRLTQAMITVGEEEPQVLRLRAA